MHALWTLCDPLHPEHGVCLSVEQVKEIRRQNIVRESVLKKSIVDEHERADKAEARLKATAASNLVATVLAIVLPPVVAAAASVAGAEIEKLLHR